MAKDYRIGPCRVLVASSITDPVEGWTDLGETRGDVIARPEAGRYAIGRADQKGMTGLSDAVWDTGPQASFFAPLLEHSLAMLQKVFPSSVLTTASGESALGLGNGTGKVTPKAFCLVPTSEYTAGEAWWDAAHAVWFPKGVAQQVDAKALNLPDGDDALSGSGFTFQFRALLADSTMPASCRTMGIGPIWKLGAPVLGIDFVLEAGHDASAVALIGGTKTFTRTGTAWGFEATTGKLTAYGTDVIRRELKGWLIEPQRTNKCMRNYLHGGVVSGWTKQGDAAATLTAVTDAAELAAAGLDVVCSDSYVLKLDNSAGVGEAMAWNGTAYGNTNQHALSVYWRGSGSGRVSSNGGAQPGNGSIPASYQRATRVITPGNASDTVQIVAAAGAVSYFVLAQFEEGAFATAPIPNAGDGSITRNADTLSYAYTKAVDTGNGISVHVDFAPLFAEGIASSHGVFIVGSTADPRMAMRHVGGTWNIVVDDGATLTEQPLSGDSIASGITSEVTTVWDAALVKKWRANQADADVTPGGSTAAAPPAGSWGGSVIVVGSDGNVLLGGHISRLVVVRGNRTPAKLRKLKRAA